MDVYGKGTDGQRLTFNQVAEALVADLRYAGNVAVSPDAHPLRNETGFCGRIVVVSSFGAGARRSASGRRGPWACWHAYRDAMRGVLTRYPDATIKTGRYETTRYRGLAHFEATHAATAEVDIGSVLRPARLGDLCECDDSPPSPRHWQIEGKDPETIVAGEECKTDRCQRSRAAGGALCPECLMADVRSLFGADER